ncbi:hypothetical protein ACFQ3N_00855 [Virgibacillus byunsanensis]|uniref:Uncharacterized protein n=1 Tax=Virgibacillus byunsanensis TaxID=570945 RepID=A0ABW3LF49_9BACI
MGETTIYFLFTDTGTYLSRAINFATRQPLNHVSISFDRDLQEVYSFGRKKPRNPFIGGFVKEDIRSDFLKNSDCAVYACQVSDSDVDAVMSHIKEIEQQKDNFKYNFIGLIAVLLQVEINRENAMFCSQFVGTILQDVDAFQFGKPTYFLTPGDIRKHDNLQLIYQGKLGNYQQVALKAGRKLIKGETSSIPKKSYLLLLSKKVKRFVIR